MDCADTDIMTLVIYLVKVFNEGKMSKMIPEIMEITRQIEYSIEIEE